MLWNDRLSYIELTLIQRPEVGMNQDQMQPTSQFLHSYRSVDKQTLEDSGESCYNRSISLILEQVDTDVSQKQLRGA